MAKPVPSPVAACVGLVPAVLDQVLRLPGRAVQVPVIAVSSALQAVDSARREYDDLADRGERLIARLLGSSTPVQAAATKVRDGLVDAAQDAAGVTGATAQAAATALADGASAASDATQRLSDRAGRGAELFAVPDDAGAAPDGAEADDVGPAQDGSGGIPDPQAVKGRPTPQATEPDPRRPDTAASAGVVRTVEQVAAAVKAPKVDDHAALPLADYDHMTLGSLRGRLRSLDVDQLLTVRAYEQAHADRLPVVTMLDNRIAKLAATAGSPSATGASGAPLQAPTAEERSRGRGVATRSAAAGPDAAAPAHTKVRLT